MILLALAFCVPASAGSPPHRFAVAGTWYLALDAHPYGLPEGITLPGLLNLSRDGTFMLADGGDFGGFPFPRRDSAQFGVWRYAHGRIRMVSLFLQANAISGDVEAWQKVHLTLRFKDRNTLVGTVNVFGLDCLGAAPAGVFNCPDPIAGASDFVQAPEENVTVTLRRLPARFVLPAH